MFHELYETWPQYGAGGCQFCAVNILQRCAILPMTFKKNKPSIYINGNQANWQLCFLLLCATGGLTATLLLSSAVRCAARRAPQRPVAPSALSGLSRRLQQSSPVISLTSSLAPPGGSRSTAYTLCSGVWGSELCLVRWCSRCLMVQYSINTLNSSTDSSFYPLVCFDSYGLCVYQSGQPADAEEQTQKQSNGEWPPPFFYRGFCSAGLAGCVCFALLVDKIDESSPVYASSCIAAFTFTLAWVALRLPFGDGRRKKKVGRCTGGASCVACGARPGPASPPILVRARACRRDKRRLGQIFAFGAG